MKKLFSLLLTLVMLCSLIPAASAASPEAQQAAEALYELGLFRGNGTLPDGSPNFALDQTPTRNQAVIMLVRLLGKEEEALAGTWDISFTDVSKASAAYPYIGYAYANKLTNGTSATTFGGGNPIRANQYITFVLRALSYTSGAGKDFLVSTAWEFSDSLGITNGQYNAANSGSFLRSGIAEISCSALSAKVNGTETTLLEKLKADGAVSPAAPTPPNSDTLPTDLTFKTIAPGYYQAWGNSNLLKSFQLKSLEYADSGSDVYFRVNYSGDVKKFFVVPMGIPNTNIGMGEMMRCDAPASGGVFTCKVSKDLFLKYPCLLISPTEDGKSGPVDYFIFMGYLQLTENGSPAVFQNVEVAKADRKTDASNTYVDDSYEVADFKFESVEYADVVGGRLYRIRFTNDAHRNIQFWTVKENQSGGFNQNLLRVVHPQAGESEAFYFVPHSSLENYDLIYVRIRDSYAIDPNGGKVQEHSGVFIYF